jgi:hypothetical protein
MSAWMRLTRIKRDRLALDRLRTHMTDVPSFPYELLWQERQLLSVANLTRNDGAEFFKVAAQASAGEITGAAVRQP